MTTIFLYGILMRISISRLLERGLLIGSQRNHIELPGIDMDDAAMVYLRCSYPGRGVWDFVRICTHHPVLQLLPAEGNRQWFAIDQVFSAYNMQLDNNGGSVIIFPNHD